MAKTNLKVLEKTENNSQKETEVKMTPEDLYYKLDYARSDVMIELFKMEALIKLGYEVTSAEEGDDTEDSVSWLSVFQILADIKNKATEKVELLETLIYDLKEWKKEA